AISQCDVHLEAPAPARTPSARGRKRSTAFRPNSISSSTPIPATAGSEMSASIGSPAGRSKPGFSTSVSRAVSRAASTASSTRSRIEVEEKPRRPSTSTRIPRPRLLELSMPCSRLASKSTESLAPSAKKTSAWRAPPAAARSRACSRSSSSVTTDAHPPDSQVGPAVADWQRPLAGFAAASAGLFDQDRVFDRLDVLQGCESVAGQRHVAYQLARLAVLDQVGEGGREGEHLAVGLAAHRADAVEAPIDASKDLRPGRPAGPDHGRSHTHDRRVPVGDGASVAGRQLAHGSGGLSGMEAADHPATLDEVGAARRHPLLVIAERAARPRHQARVVDLQLGDAQLGAECHDLPELRVLMQVVGLAQVSDGFVREDARQPWVNHDQVVAGLRLGGAEEARALPADADRLLLVELREGGVRAGAGAEAATLDPAL